MLFSASEAARWTYGSRVAFAGIYCRCFHEYLQVSYALTGPATFVYVVTFVLELGTGHGHSRMILLVRTVLPDSFLYFPVTMWFHTAVAFSTFFAKVISFSPLPERRILT